LLPWLGIESTALGLRSQSVAYDLSATTTPSIYCSPYLATYSRNSYNLVLVPHTPWTSMNKFYALEVWHQQLLPLGYKVSRFLFREVNCFGQFKRFIWSPWSWNLQLIRLLVVKALNSKIIDRKTFLSGQK